MIFYSYMQLRLNFQMQKNCMVIAPTERVHFKIKVDLNLVPNLGLYQGFLTIFSNTALVHWSVNLSIFVYLCNRSYNFSEVLLEVRVTKVTWPPDF